MACGNLTSQIRDWTCVPVLAGGFWTSGPLRKSHLWFIFNLKFCSTYSLGPSLFTVYSIKKPTQILLTLPITNLSAIIVHMPCPSAFGRSLKNNSFLLFTFWGNGLNILLLTVQKIMTVEGISDHLFKPSQELDFWPRDWIQVSCVGRQTLHHWATRWAHWRESLVLKSSWQPNLWPQNRYISAYYTKRSGPSMPSRVYKPLPWVIS